jgi:type I restriction enzyme S subunit
MTQTNFSYLEFEYPILLKINQLPLAILTKAFRGELVEQEVKEYVVEEREGLMAAEPKMGYGTE